MLILHSCTHFAEICCPLTSTYHQIDLCDFFFGEFSRLNVIILVTFVFDELFIINAHVMGV